MVVFLVVLHVIISFLLVLSVLLQPGKGADLAGAFGGAGSQTFFGARGAMTVLHKVTTGLFIGFVLTSMGLAIVQARPRASIIREGAPVTAPAPTTTAPGTAPASPAPAAPAPAAPEQPAPAPVQQ